MLGAWALIFALGILLTIEFLNTAEPYIPARERPSKIDQTLSPKLIMSTTETELNILQVDEANQPVRLVYSSDLKDNVADFKLFAVPQINYAGKIYLESTQDAAGPALIVYPFDMSTSNISPAILNLPRQFANLSPEQNRVAVINLLPTRNLAIYDLTTGLPLASWTLASNEFFNDNKSARYTGPGPLWTSNNCVDHNVWVNNVLELRTFCVESPVATSP